MSIAALGDGLTSSEDEGALRLPPLVLSPKPHRIKHILPRHNALTTAAPGNRPQSARRRGRPSASSRAAPPHAE